MIKKVMYIVFISLLTIIAVLMAFLEILGKIEINQSKVLYSIDLSILIIFAIDYFVRLLIAKNRKKYFKENIFDLLAIIPVNSLFRAFRLVRVFRLFRLLRVFALLKKLDKNCIRFLKTNNFIYVIYLSLSTIILGSISIYFIVSFIN